MKLDGAIGWSWAGIYMHKHVYINMRCVCMCMCLNPKPVCINIRCMCMCMCVFVLGRSLYTQTHICTVCVCVCVYVCVCVCARPSAPYRALLCCISFIHFSSLCPLISFFCSRRGILAVVAASRSPSATCGSSDEHFSLPFVPDAARVRAPPAVTFP